MKKIVNVLWTGGLDSTCRIAELSQQDVIIQPYYIMDPSRKSIPYELRAMATITELIRKNAKTTAELREIIKVELDNIEADEEISTSYENLRKKYKLGSQYDFLARFAKQKNMVLEVGLECSPRSKAYNTIIGECKELVKNKEFNRYEINRDVTSFDGIHVLERLTYPCTLWHKSKKEEVEYMKSLGLGNLIDKTHFCHNPIMGLTCGQCNPCKDALKEDMAWRVSILGQILGILRKYFIIYPKSALRRLLKY